MIGKLRHGTKRRAEEASAAFEARKAIRCAQARAIEAKFHEERVAKVIAEARGAFNTWPGYIAGLVDSGTNIAAQIALRRADMACQRASDAARRR